MNLFTISALMLCVVMLTGCGLTRGTMFDGSICAMQSDEEAKTAMRDLLASLPDGEDKAKAQEYAALADVSATVLCETRRAIEAKQTAK